jgi:CBS domain-containing protein
MKIAELMRRNVTTCALTDSLDHAASLMWSADIGSLPVVDTAGHPIGMITDRDICMRAHFSGRPLREEQVADAMSQCLVAIGADQSVQQAEEVMRDHQIRRLPVVENGGALVGVVSLTDLARSACENPVRSELIDVARTVQALGAPRDSMSDAA